MRVSYGSYFLPTLSQVRLIFIMLLTSLLMSNCALDALGVIMPAGNSDHSDDPGWEPNDPTWGGKE